MNLSRIVLTLAILIGGCETSSTGAIPDAGDAGSRCFQALEREAPPGEPCDWRGVCAVDVGCPSDLESVVYMCVDGGLVVQRTGCPDAGPQD